MNAINWMIVAGAVVLPGVVSLGWVFLRGFTVRA